MVTQQGARHGGSAIEDGTNRSINLSKPSPGFVYQIQRRVPSDISCKNDPLPQSNAKADALLRIVTKWLNQENMSTSRSSVPTGLGWIRMRYNSRDSGCASNRIWNISCTAVSCVSVVDRANEPLNSPKGLEKPTHKRRCGHRPIHAQLHSCLILPKLTVCSNSLVKGLVHLDIGGRPWYSNLKVSKEWKAQNHALARRRCKFAPESLHVLLELLQDIVTAITFLKSKALLKKQQFSRSLPK